MEDSGHNLIVHSVKPKNEGKLRRNKRLTIAGYILFCVVYICAVTIPVQLYPTIAGVPFFLYALIRITWWRFDYGFDYTLSHGELRVEKVYSASRRREIARILVKDASAIAPLAGLTLPATVIDVRSTASAPNSYGIVYRSPEGTETALLFEATAKMAKMMARFNPATVVSEDLPL